VLRGEGMDGNLFVTIGSVTVAVIGAVATAIMTYLTWSHKSRQEKVKADTDRHEALIDRQEKQIVRMQSVQDQQQRTIMSLQDEHSECQAELERNWAWMERFRDLACSLVSTLRKSGHECDDVPPLPARRENRAAALEYQARSTEQNRRLANELRPPTPPPSDSVPARKGP
jgi:gas vesicle protein